MALGFKGAEKITLAMRLKSGMLHGMVGGLTSKIAGGKFASGFLAGGFGDLAGGEFRGRNTQ